MLRSKDAETILAFPTVHHPQLRDLHIKLADNAIVTKAIAIERIVAEMERLKLNWLDIEMANPAQSARAPFAITSHSPETDFQRAVEASVRHRLGIDR